MSYFMTTAGPWIDLSDLAPIELVPAEKAQQYVRQRIGFLSGEDGQPLYLVHDGETGTSDNFISAASSHFAFNGTIAGCPLSDLLERLCQAGHVFRIWDASNEENAHTQVMEYHSPDEVLRATEMCIKRYEDIQIRYAGHRS